MTRRAREREIPLRLLYYNEGKARMTGNRISRPSCRRRGVVAVIVIMMLAVLMGFAALTIDVGTMYNVKSDLQHAADAAAIAGATALTGDAMMVVRQGGADGLVYSMVTQRVHYISLQNGSIGTQYLTTQGNDIGFGWIDLNSATSTIVTSLPNGLTNAITVTVRQTANSPNGSLKFLFAPLLGIRETDIIATATAAFDDRLIGFEPPASGPNPFAPFTIHENVYNAVGPDNYSFDASTGSLVAGSDGITEINLYPHAENGNGNFGLLNIGAGNNGTPAMRRQIEEGITPDELEEEIGTSAIDFWDEYGTPITYTIDGTPGLRATLEASLQTRVGDVIAVLLHNSVSGTGSNSYFQITGIRFARVMAANLNGNPKNVWLQPATLTGTGVRTSPAAASSGGIGGQLVLVR